jgi:hypothetical protein
MASTLEETYVASVAVGFSEYVLQSLCFGSRDIRDKLSKICPNSSFVHEALQEPGATTTEASAVVVLRYSVNSVVHHDQIVAGASEMGLTPI